MHPSNQTRQSREERARLLVGVCSLGFLLVSCGLVRLQVVEHAKYRGYSEKNYVRHEVLRAPRGAILDRNGEILADSAPSFNIVFRPKPLDGARAAPAPEVDWLVQVASATGLDTAQVRERVVNANRNGRTAVLVHNAPFAIRAAVEESREDLPGVDVVVEPLRRYALGTVASHLLGYAGEINDQELDSLAVKGYQPGDLIGRSGIERTYEEMLRGQDGEEYVVVNAAGRRVSSFDEKPPKPPIAGHDLRLTVDLEVQRALEEVMEGVGRGAAVALDPRDGGILGLVSRPAFDPNEFSVGISFARWRELTSGGQNPLLNRAIQGVYPPGSTFKIVTMLSAMDAGVAAASSRFAPCLGSYPFGGRAFGCWKREGHGSLDFIGALEHSCDVYFYQVGLKLGLPKLEATARAFGLGARTGIDLPQEKGGLVPSPAWYDRRWGAGKWRKGLLLNLAIGQGEFLATPLQLALLVAEAANHGRPIRPHIVSEVTGVGPVKHDGPSRGRIESTAAHWAAIDQALERVVVSGTAGAAKVPGVRVAGKTGTAQNPHGDDHALFVCYAPAENPEIALAFVIENSGHGGSVAAPKAGRVLSRLFLPDSLQNPAIAAKAPAAPPAGEAEGD